MATPSLKWEWSHDVLYDSRYERIDIESRVVKLTIVVWALSRFQYLDTLAVMEVGSRFEILLRR